MSSASVLPAVEEKVGQQDASSEKTINLPPLPQALREWPTPPRPYLSLHGSAAAGGIDAGRKNPFKMPPDHELFVLREKERKKLKEV